MRKKHNLPKFLEFNEGNKTFYYRNPRYMQRKANLGKHRTYAIDTARSLNKKFSELEQSHDVSLDSNNFDEALSIFGRWYPDERRLKAKTRETFLQRVNRLHTAIGSRPLAALRTVDLANALQPMSVWEQNKCRALLVAFFRWAKSTGLYPSHLPNPADDLLVRRHPEKQRQRMTLAQFWAIYQHAEVWLRWAMTLALHLGLRRQDLVNLRLDDAYDGAIRVVVSKASSATRLKIVRYQMSADVRAVITASRESSLALGRCPYVIHRLPKRLPAKTRVNPREKDEEHFARVTPDLLSKYFAAARDRSGCCDHIPAGQRPGIHEIRALCAHLMEEAGYQITEVQDLLVHQDQKMTEHYQAGHREDVMDVNLVLPGELTKRLP